MGDKDSATVITVKRDFFAKSSEKRLERKRQKEQEGVSSTDGNNSSLSPMDSLANTKSPRLSKQKQKLNNTFVKNGVLNGLKGKCSRQVLDDVVPPGEASHLIPDLRLESKKLAEEHSRMFAGKQLHPFFQSCKPTNRRLLGADEAECKSCLVNKDDHGWTLGPVHVFETNQDDVVYLDWRNWIFCEKALSDARCGLGRPFTSISEGSVESLCFDDFLRILHHSATFVHQNKMSLDESPIEQESLLAQTSSVILADKQLLSNQIINNAGVDCEVGNAECFLRHAGDAKDLDNEHHVTQRMATNVIAQLKVMEEREIYRDENKSYGVKTTKFQVNEVQPCHYANAIGAPSTMTMTYYHDSNNVVDDSLWTKKYQPNRAAQVCGNAESVKHLSEWLHLWHERDFGSSKGLTNGDSGIMPEIDEDYFGSESESDSDDMDNEAGLQNVLLVTGPVGCGKTAAVYACAREQGFNVLEVNTSDWRNGTLVKQRFGEALESHHLKQSLENHVSSQSMCTTNTSPASPSSYASKEIEKEVIELIALSDDENSQEQTETKSLVLFEDVDIPFIEDRGFIAAIQQLAENAKLPMILTANSNVPILPYNVGRLELCFTVPSLKELLAHLYMVCSAEKINIDKPLIKQFINYCHGDMRKSIMHVQFWCHGQRYKEGVGDDEVSKTFGKLPFDPDTGHKILPKIVPWGFPSQLSELVEKEITKAFSSEDGDHSDDQRIESIQTASNQTDSIKIKKEAILRRHCSDHSLNEYEAQIDNLCEQSSSSGSPIAFSRRNIRRKLDTVLSFSSEDEFLDVKFVVTSNEEINREVFSEFGCNSPLCLKDEIGPQCSDTGDYIKYANKCESINISLVPESSFVPETEIHGEEFLSRSVFSGHASDTAGPVLLNNDLGKYHSPGQGNHLGRYIKNSEIDKNAFAVIGDSTREEAMGDSQVEDVETVTRGYQVMDECSRFFSKYFKPAENSGSRVMANSTEGVWRRLRGWDPDLRQYLTPEERIGSQIMELTFGLVNLISEADLLLSNSQRSLGDFLEQLVDANPSEETDKGSWCNEQLLMTSAVAEHGLCLHAKNIAALRLSKSSGNTLNLTRETLDSSINTEEVSETQPGEIGTSFKRDRDLRLHDILQSVVPRRLHLAMKGDAFLEYLSSLGQISKSEASRLAESGSKIKGRRRRVAKHYLSTGKLMLSPEDISLLSQHSCFGRFPYRSTDASSEQNFGSGK